ncbi:MAG: hypothetical protein HYV09_31435 [Deltaproteobacteria bacterium]|nr:hypothetical protein [Deltaproteobacteria bacterium]
MSSGGSGGKIGTWGWDARTSTLIDPAKVGARDVEIDELSGAIDRRLPAQR